MGRTQKKGSESLEFARKNAAYLQGLGGTKPLWKVFNPSGIRIRNMQSFPML